jgi:hypothetical protein
MPMKMLRHTIVILLSFAPYVVGHAADMKIDCRLQGGSVVQLTPLACGIEGGTPVNGAVLPAPAASPEPVDKGAAQTQTAANSKLAATQMAIIDLLDREVVDTTPLNRNPEGIERSARFDGCKLMVDEILHIKYGNFYSVWKDFKISSVIDLQNLDRDVYGVWDKVSSKGGDFSAAAVYIEERNLKEGNSNSISVLLSTNKGYKKYSFHGPSYYLDAPEDNLWIADEYGYPRDNGLGDAATDTIRILLIVDTPADAEKLKGLLENINAMCKPQPAKAD